MRTIDVFDINPGRVDELSASLNRRLHDTLDNRKVNIMWERIPHEVMRWIVIGASVESTGEVPTDEQIAETLDEMARLLDAQLVRR